MEPDGDHDVVPVEDALARARDHELDLVEIAPDADPPVCKILDYGKYRYEKQKEEKRRRKKSKSMEMKELRFRPRTEEHDFNFKVDHAREFLEDGNKVKAYVQFRGRDIVYKDQGMDLLRRLIERLQDVARGINALRDEQGTGVLQITHYQRILDYVTPDVVHIMLDGEVVMEGGPELAVDLEDKGYDWVREEVYESA